jgi:3-hydroxyisobutyrate dehydrogenase-like beta-hydroxyacid dehydrogenase
MKLVNNFMAAGILATVAEALSIGIKSGLTLETIMKATERSGTYNRLLLDVLPTRAFKGDFGAGFRTALALKDQRLALALADDVGANLAVGPVVEQLFAEIVRDTPDVDFTALLLRQEKQDGFEARLAAPAGD